MGAAISKSSAEPSPGTGETAVGTIRFARLAAHVWLHVDMPMAVERSGCRQKSLGAL